MRRVSSHSTTSASRSSSSTRSVTSPRLPIGVAQTTSGSPPHRSRRAPRSRPARRRPGRVVAELRLDDAELVVRRLERLAARRFDGRLAQELPRGDPEPSADDDDLGREDVRERADREPEVVTDPLDGAARASSSPPRRLADEPVRVGVATLQLRARPLGRLPGRDRLEVAAPVAVALAGRAVRLDDDVAELRPAAVQAPVEHEPPPTPVPSASATRSVTPRPAPRRHSASAIALPSFSTPTGMPKRSASRRARSSDSSGRLTARWAMPVFRSMFIGTPTPIARRRRAALEQRLELDEERLLARRGRRHLDRPADGAVAREARRGSSSRRHRLR